MGRDDHQWVYEGDGDVVADGSCHHHETTKVVVGSSTWFAVCTYVLCIFVRRNAKLILMKMGQLVQGLSVDETRTTAGPAADSLALCL